jgi:uncharacterized membrane protein YdbT with pleckstrin-like domain
MLIFGVFFAALIAFATNPVLDWIGVATQGFRWVPYVVAVALVGVALLSFLVKILVHKSKLYRITNDRVEYEFGLLSKRVHNIDLFRVKDITLTQSFFQRMLGVGVIHVFSSDKSHPQFDIGPIDGVRGLYDKLKKLSLHADRRRGVVHFDG